MPATKQEKSMPATKQEKKPIEPIPSYVHFYTLPESVQIKLELYCRLNNNPALFSGCREYYKHKKTRGLRWLCITHLSARKVAPGCGHFLSQGCNMNMNLILSRKFLVNWPFFQLRWLEIDFQDGNRGGHLGFSIANILAVFDQQVTQILPIKF